ncbi:MAG: TonB-dependent receptor plug domain-containing protein [Chitinophagaceae bacterium]|nr:TonB-dependent receptor plug domain-containing protein [Chitinophagaceae bacterium]
MLSVATNLLTSIKNKPLFCNRCCLSQMILTGSSGAITRRLTRQYGAAMVNPDDVETMTVLKSMSSALYGSRAANGVIMIPPNPVNSKGIGVTVRNTGVTLSPLVLLKFQESYGQGNNGQFSWDGKGGGASDGVDESWGPKMDGSLIAQHNSPTSNGYRGGDISLVDDGMWFICGFYCPKRNNSPTPFIAGYGPRKFYKPV